MPSSPSNVELMLLAQIEGVKANTALTYATADLRSAEAEAVRADTRSKYGK